MSNDEGLKRKAILEVYSNTTLSPQEKQSKIAEIMKYNYTSLNEGKNDDPEECPHYTRGCWVQCTLETCKRFVSCRFCHPEINRYAITTVKCKTCNLTQPFTNQCGGCETIFGTHYYCNICHIFISDPTRDDYHCEKCGVCRVGTREESYHCDRCNSCFNIEVRDHLCISEHETCAICKESFVINFFDHYDMSRISVKCGHLFHIRCVNKQIQIDYRCPLCRKSMIDLTEDTMMLDEYLDSPPDDMYEGIPEDIRKREVSILCNECEETFEAPFSPFQLYKCEKCNVYNTTLV